jgi:DNA mismatch endonuclease (patch repair protein)
MPKTNVGYWSAKIARNKARDYRIRRRLQKDGWKTLVIWECAVRDEAAVLRRLSAFLKS